MSFGDALTFFLCTNENTRFYLLNYCPQRLTFVSSVVNIFQILNWTALIMYGIFISIENFPLKQINFAKRIVVYHEENIKISSTRVLLGDGFPKYDNTIFIPGCYNHIQAPPFIISALYIFHLL